MNVIIDIGNTRTKIALFQKNTVIEKAIWEHLTLDELSAWLQRHPVKNIILTASGQITEGVVQFLQKHYFFIQLDHTTLLPIVNDYGTPQTLGKDRLAAAVAANFLFPNKNCLYLDSGTCITYNFIDAKGHFKGGNIAPGLNMRLKAMHHFTAKLPLIVKNREGISISDLVGKTTEQAMLNGAHIGLISEVEGFIQRFKKTYGSIKVILTGGDGAFLYQNIGYKQVIYEPDLVLIGLNQILNYNSSTLVL
jgi:type III pantothenate kinase